LLPSSKIHHHIRFQNLIPVQTYGEKALAFPQDPSDLPLICTQIQERQSTKPVGFELNHLKALPGL
jgi:hypothetical protein